MVTSGQRGAGSREEHSTRQPSALGEDGHTTVSTRTPPGLFTRDAATIARTLALPRVSTKGPGSGLRMLSFFVNRAGRQLFRSRRSELERARRLMRKGIEAQGARGDAMKVREIMRHALVTIRPDAQARAAAELMRSRQVRHVLVTDEQERLVGIVTDRDLRHSAFLPVLAPHLAREERWLRAPRVRDVMTWSVVTVEPDADLVRAGLLMFERRIGSLPVTDHGTLVGILTERDVFEAFRTAGESPDPAELYLG